MKRFILTILFILTTNTSYSAQFLYKEVAPSGGDYTSLEACMAANEQDLTGDGWFDVEITGDWTSSPDTTVVSVDTYVTTADDYINIFTSGDARHDGKRYGSKATAHVLYNTTNYKKLIDIQDGYITVDGLQVNNAATTTNTRHAFEAGSYNTIINNICKITQSVYGCMTLGITGSIAYNNLIHCSIADGLDIGGTNNANEIYNNTVIGAAGCVDAFDSNDQTITSTVRNNLCITAGTRCYHIGNATKSNNGGSDTTGEIDNLTAANLFVSVTGGSEDYHLKTGADAIDVGFDLSGTFTTDIDGDTRGATFDIGADEYIAVGGRTRRFF